MSQLRPASSKRSSDAQPRARPARCACGGRLLASGECAECQAKRMGDPLMAQDARAHPSAAAAAPSSRVHGYGHVPVHSEAARAFGPDVELAARGDPRERAAVELARRVAAVPPAAGEAPPGAGSAQIGGPGGQALPPALRAHFEPRLGQDLGGVRLHTDANAARLTRSLGAAAFAYGSDIYIGERRYAPASPAGRSLLAHELAHTLQQRAEPRPIIQRLEVCDEEGVCRPGPDEGASSDVSSTTAVASRPASAAELDPPGDCSPSTHRALQNEVNRACKGDRRCGQTDSCPTLWEKINNKADCIRARATVNARCFRGGDRGHLIKLGEDVAGLAQCWSVYQRQCKGSKTSPAPVPEPKTAPAIDPSLADKISKITGLTGTALTIYLIISEGSRLFPPRNLIPIP